MNFLQLVNRARSECGVSGAALQTVQGALSKEAQRFKDWIADAWRDVQMHREDWTWMRKSASFQTVEGQADYSLAAIGATDLDDWIASTFRVYPTARGVAGELHMEFAAYDDFRDRFNFGTSRTNTGHPLWWTAQPDRSLRIWPLPNGAYTVTGDYRRAPGELAADDDTPASSGLPDRFHMLMVYKAMEHYGLFEAAPEVLARGEKGWAREMGRLEDWGLPNLVMGPALA